MSTAPPRAGYTRSGKSLKAVRRYYAIQNAMKNKAEESPKSPKDEDKISKRIAAELNQQQIANEKRNRTSGNLSESPTDRSALPNSAVIIVSPKETGPVFIAPEAAQKSIKSAKSMKSTRSGAPPNANAVDDFGHVGDLELGSCAVSCLITCATLAAIYLAIWIFMIIDSSRGVSSPIVQDTRDVEKRSARWMGITSIFVLIVIPYWIYFKNNQIHAILCMLAIIGTTISTFVFLLIELVFKSPPERKNDYVYMLNIADPTFIWLTIAFFVFHIITLSFMIRQALNFVWRRVGETATPTPNTSHANMSNALGAR